MRVAWASILAVLIAVMPALAHTCDRGCGSSDAGAAPVDRAARLTAAPAPGDGDADCPLHASAPKPGPPSPAPPRPVPCQHDAATVSVDAVKSLAASPSAPAVVTPQAWHSSRRLAIRASMPPPRTTPALPPAGLSSVLRI